MRSVALDLGAKSISYCEVMDGKVIERATVRSLSSLVDKIGPNTRPARVLFEACREAWRVHDWLKASGHQPLMLDTTRAKKLGVGQHRRKNDRIDAETLALAVDEGRVPLAHVLSEHRRELRYQLSVRRALVQTRAQMVALVRETARARGHKVPTCMTRDFLGKLRLAKLDESTRALIAPIQTTLETVNAQLQLVDAKLVQLCETEPTIKLLMTAPRVGPIVAAAFVSVIDEARRFSSAHQVEAYLGLVPSESSSGGPKQRLGAITKAGNSYARAMLVEAAWGILSRFDANEPLRIWALAVAARRGRRIAAVAVARRLAGVLWAMWRDSTTYDGAHLGLKCARGLERSSRQQAAHAHAIERAANKYKRFLNKKAASVDGNRRFPNKKAASVDGNRRDDIKRARCKSQRGS